MFGLDIGDVMKGYTNEQYSEALVSTLINYLSEKGIIDINDYFDYYSKNNPKILEKIIERDRAKAKEAYEKYKKGEQDGTN